MWSVVCGRGLCWRRVRRRLGRLWKGLWRRVLEAITRGFMILSSIGHRGFTDGSGKRRWVLRIWILKYSSTNCLPIIVDLSQEHAILATSLRQLQLAKAAISECSVALEAISFAPLGLWHSVLLHVLTCSPVDQEIYCICPKTASSKIPVD